MNILDWVLICTGAFWVLRGLMRGAISQILGIAGIFAGFLVASHFYEQVAFYLSTQVPLISGTASGPVSFVLLFLVSWFIVGVAGFWIVQVAHGIGLGFLDRLWGGMIGLGKAFLFAIVTVSILTLFSADGNPTLLARSRLAPTVREASDFLFKMAPESVQRELSRKRQDVQKMVGERPYKVLDPLLDKDANSRGKSEGTRK